MRFIEDVKKQVSLLFGWMVDRYVIHVYFHSNKTLTYTFVDNFCV